MKTFKTKSGTELPLLNLKGKDYLNEGRCLMKTFKTKSGTELPLLNLKGKDYLKVAHRLVWFREEHPDYTIETEFLVLEKGRSIARATIRLPDGRILATATKSEDIKGFPDFVEKSETGAIGRALALIGYGTQFAPELDEGERIVDSPLPPKKMGSAHESNAREEAPSTATSAGPYIIPFGKYKGQQINSIPFGYLKDYADFIKSTNGQKPMSDMVKEFLDRVDLL